MCNCNDCPNRSDSCVCDVVKFIDILQKQVKPCEKYEGCDRPRLGHKHMPKHKFNTRPFVLYMCDGSIFKALVGMGPEPTSPYLRVEELDGCCCKCRVLVRTIVPGSESEVKCGKPKLRGTDQFVTINLCCCCAIQCLDDTFIHC